MRLAGVFVRTTISQSVSWVVLCEFPVVKVTKSQFFPSEKSSCYEQGFHCILLYFPVFSTTIVWQASVTVRNAIGCGICQDYNLVSGEPGSTV